MNTRLLDHLVNHVPSAIRRAGLPDNQCILASRLAVEFLRHHGIRAQATASDLTVINAPYADALEANGGVFDDTLREQAEADGAWCVWISRVNTDTVGHVVVVADNRWLIDLTAHQANRPEKGISAEAFYADALDFAHGERFGFRNADDRCVWIYDPRPKDRSFVARPAWSAYRISTRNGMIVSERTGPAPDVAVAPSVAIPLRA